MTTDRLTYAEAMARYVATTRPYREVMAEAEAEGPAIKTNGHTRDLLSYADLSDAIRAEFDYLADEPEEHYSPRFFEYRGSWYDANDGFTRVTDSALSGWDGAQGESYFSAVLIRYTEDYRAVVVGYAHW